ncbi:MAG: MBL fold metallo-hydrolase [Clostridia bacterium]|nr:MBL fold metallo-hydrolase [Clostridia bacterium]
MARLCTLSSGSKGNSTYISYNGGAILVDAGISYKSMIPLLDSVGGDISQIKAVAITHTHSDHTKGLKTFLKNTKIPLIASEQTLQTLAQSNMIPETTKTFAVSEKGLAVDEVFIDFFKTKHDAEGSGGYVISLPDGRRAAVCTDLGIVTDEVRSKILGCDTVLIESNHDVEMLRRGPYAAQLKLRILSDTGHLSNNACAVELPNLLKSGTTRIILGHLSEENNTPIIAKSSAAAMLDSIGAKEDIDYILTIAKPRNAGVTVF